jgi:hypothetical protein
MIAQSFEKFIRKLEYLSKGEKYLLAYLVHREILKRLDLLPTKQCLLYILSKKKYHANNFISQLIRDYITYFLYEYLDLLLEKEKNIEKEKRLSRLIRKKVRQDAKKASTFGKEFEIDIRRTKEWLLLTIYLLIENSGIPLRELIKKNFFYHVLETIREIVKNEENFKVAYEEIYNEEDVCDPRKDITLRFSPQTADSILNLYRIIRGKEDKFYQRTKEIISLMSKRNNSAREILGTSIDTEDENHKQTKLNK